MRQKQQQLEIYVQQRLLRSRLDHIRVHALNAFERLDAHNQIAGNEAYANMVDWLRKRNGQLHSDRDHAFEARVYVAQLEAMEQTVWRIDEADWNSGMLAWCEGHLEDFQSKEAFIAERITCHKNNTRQHLLRIAGKHEWH